ncbi:hypothetical protein N8E89_09335 [Phyllobacterium sp. A18/5-2]|uniref:hypothetical protein n=1 Tax=Phyllobacterium sp. A18/5-2 TaxID=2978392 RepID=UPI0021C865E3|nr:hypothetical protein [Phyllobacterium sp. A18/5-2]UXN62918.1 hypothetical protein N8E89_09335 [Phyllobacterium sp. A18/5-2]
MLIQFDDRGFITHIRSDPESQEIIDNFVAKGDWMHLPVIPLPAVAVRDDNGKVVIEDGKVKRESPGYTHLVVTHDFHYVKDGVVLDRPTLPAGDVEIKADGIDAYVLEGLPVPCTVLMDGVLVEIDDGLLEFSTADAGTYVFESVFPFVDGAKIRVTATEVSP